MLIGGFFAVFSLGPALHIWGREVVHGRLSYAWLERIFPPLRMSGVPVRMIVMTQLAVAVLVPGVWTISSGPSGPAGWLLR